MRQQLSPKVDAMQWDIVLMKSKIRNFEKQGNFIESTLLQRMDAFEAKLDNLMTLMSISGLNAIESRLYGPNEVEKKVNQMNLFFRRWFKIHFSHR